jgi:hypothetical protein
LLVKNIRYYQDKLEIKKIQEEKEKIDMHKRKIPKYMFGLNKYLNERKEIRRFMPFLLTKLILLDRREYNHENIAKSLGRKQKIINFKKINLSNGLKGSVILETEIYVQMQLILEEITGKYWTLDKIVNLLVNWFVFVYKRDAQDPKYFPFKYIETKNRYEMLKKFHESFNIYYKRMMHSWGEDKP